MQNSKENIVFFCSNLGRMQLYSRGGCCNSNTMTDDKTSSEQDKEGIDLILDLAAWALNSKPTLLNIYAFLLLTQA